MSILNSCVSVFINQSINHMLCTEEYRPPAKTLQTRYTRKTHHGDRNNNVATKSSKSNQRILFKKRSQNKSSRTDQTVPPEIANRSPAITTNECHTEHCRRSQKPFFCITIFNSGPHRHHRRPAGACACCVLVVCLRSCMSVYCGPGCVFEWLDVIFSLQHFQFSDLHLPKNFVIHKFIHKTISVHSQTERPFVYTHAPAGLACWASEKLAMINVYTVAVSFFSLLFFWVCVRYSCVSSLLHLNCNKLKSDIDLMTFYVDFVFVSTTSIQFFHIHCWV